MSRHSTRLPDGKDGRFGRLVDRTRTIGFTFNGRRLKGFGGDTVASALLANGIDTIARSFKYHRPRGIVSIGPEEPNAFVQIGTGPNHTPSQNATQIPLTDGLSVRTQNAWPSARFDAGGLLDFVRAAIPSGFQYKTFKRPLKAWKVYERGLRMLGGVGRAPGEADPDRYEHIHAHADVLVIGGGVAGIAAAEAAAAEGLTVFLAEASPRLGGIADAYDGRIDGEPVVDWVRSKVAALAAADNVHILTRAQAAGLYDHGLALLSETLDVVTDGPEAGNVPRERLWKLRTKAIVLASGAHEKPLVFPGNDRPGIMLATSARLYLRRHGIVPGQRIVIATAGDEGYRTASDLEAAGASIARIIDLRIAPNGSLFHIAKSRGLSISVASAPVDSTARKFSGRLTGLTIANRLTIDGPALKNDIACDTLLVSGGWAPMPYLAGHLGAQLSFDETIGGFRPGLLPYGLFVAGGANGHIDLGPAIADGWRAGEAAATHIKDKNARGGRSAPSIDATLDDFTEVVGALPDISTEEERMNSFVDFQTDVTAGDMEIAIREGYRDAELLKRYTGLGLGVDQGKSAVANAAAIRSKLLRADPQDAEHTTFRPPWTPLTLGAIAGSRRGPLFRPVRATPISASFKDVIIEPFGLWNLPAAFPQAGETREAAVRREVRAVRNGIGLFDASAGAKISISGPDAAEFIDRMSATDIADTALGSSRYALFLNEDGFVQEDGVVAHVANERFLLSTGIGRAAPLTAWFERWLQTAWRDLDVVITDETERWAQILLAGPRVPELLSRIPGDIDISEFTVDSFGEGEVCGVPARALASRHTAGAEVELGVPAGYGLPLWNFLLDAGRDLGLTRFGTDALSRLRLESGAFDLDRETDGTVTPYDLGLGDLVSDSKTYFVGASGLTRPALTRPNRRHLVGILMDDRSLVPPAGAHLVLDPEHPPPRRVVGHVTTSGYSPTLRRSIALALVTAGEKHIGEKVFLVMSGENHPATITGTDFLGMAETRA